MEEVQIIKKPKVRLKFIDMARSIAILLMLEGHFIEHTFSNFKPMIALIKANGTSGNLIFDWWYFMKGFTAPLFFTVTGLVFIYLLARNKDAGFARNPRVHKGFKRVIELLFWGYALQLNFRYISNTFNHESPWLYNFHVLQSIGIGIFFLLIIFGIYKTLKVGPLYLYYFLAGTTIFLFYPEMKLIEPGVYFPENAPQIIQNIFKGPRSVFPIVPWMAFTMYGGMVGALLIRFQDYVKKTWFPLSFIILGLIFNIFGRSIGILLDETTVWSGIGNLHLVHNAWLYGRLGQIFIALGLLMFIERFFTIKDGLFLKIGQNTLPIYIIHVILLYGGIFGVGINSYLTGKLSGFMSIFGAVIFIALFALMIKYIEPISKTYDYVLKLLRIRKA